ncbi:MAG: hypothetical protein V9G42_05960 [Bacteroidia bacterium]
MSNRSEQIAYLIQKIARASVPTGSFVGKVEGVNTNDYTCDVMPISGGSIYYDVRLKPTVDSSDYGMIPIPETGSYVIVEPIARSNYFYISQFTKIKTLLIKNASGVTILFDDNGNLLLNGDQYGSMIKINDLLQLINQFIQQFNAHTHSVSGSTTLIPTGAPVQTIQASQVENSKVKHG